MKMTSFIWVQRDLSVGKIVCHLASRRTVLPPRDRQNASSKFAMRRLTPVASHIAWAKGQAKNRCEQSSTAPAHSRHSTWESRTMHSCRDLVIRRHRRRSHANTLIFRERQCVHTNWHCCKRSGSSWSRGSRYAVRAVERGSLHTHASWPASFGLQLTRSSCKLRISATCWSGNAAGKAGTQASCQARRTNTPGSVNNA